MKLISKRRGGGKTMALLRWWAADKSRIVIVATEREAALFFALAVDLYGEKPFVRAVDALKPGELAQYDAQVGIDNLDHVLWRLLGGRVDFATVTSVVPEAEPVDPNELRADLVDVAIDLAGL